MRMQAAQFQANEETVSAATLAYRWYFLRLLSLCPAACRAVVHIRSFHGMQAVTSEGTPTNQHGESADALARASSTQRPTPEL